MRKPSDLVLKAFLSRLPPERRRGVERFLPESERLRLEEMPYFTEEVMPETFANGGMLEKVHWSWFLPTLKTYSPREQKLFISSLDPFAAQNLSHELGTSETKEKITEAARGFLRQLLLHSLIGPHEQLLPAEYLPPTPLKPLLFLSKKGLAKLIDLLSMYDLGAELRQIVETKILKKIYSFLSEDERKFLKHAMAYQKEPHPLARLNLDRWDGTEEALRVHLHRKGLSRLGAALSIQDPDFIWYICHQLDIGRGNALFKLSAREAPEGLSESIVQQIEEILANPEYSL